MSKTILPGATLLSTISNNGNTSRKRRTKRWRNGSSLQGSMPTVDVSSALTQEADEAQWDGFSQRATPGVGMAHCVFVRKKYIFSSSYHISQQRGSE
jgi:hypothetical protein